MIGREECSRLKSAGRLAENVQVKIVDPNTGTALSVGQAGELWIKSPACMTGTVLLFFFTCHTLQKKIVVTGVD